MQGMRCAACGYAQNTHFPRFASKCFTNFAPIKDELSEIALELEDIPVTTLGNKMIVAYVCPNCGTIRIRLKSKMED